MKSSSSFCKQFSIYKLITIIDKIIETKKGNIDKQFWDNIITNKKTIYSEEIPISGERHIVEKEKIEIFGWIFDFFPFKIKNEGKVDPDPKDYDYKQNERLNSMYGERLE